MIQDEILTLGSGPRRAVTRPPCWRTLEESCKGLGSVSLKINNQHTLQKASFFKKKKL
jgi:hypothetical protein